MTPLRNVPNLTTLADVIAGNRGDWGREQVAALVRYVAGDAAALDERPEVKRIIDGAIRRDAREAAHLQRCGVTNESLVKAEHICGLCLETFTPNDNDNYDGACARPGEEERGAHVAAQDPTTPTEVAALVTRLRKSYALRCSDDGAHQTEDSIHRAVLRTIANGSAIDPAGMASAALETRKMTFARWCS